METYVVTTFAALSPGLPEGIFSNQKSQFGQILECLAMKEAGKFYGHLVYFTAISYTLCPFRIFCGHFGKFFRFVMLYHEKSGNPVLVHQRAAG
jgi:hypothetical protein